MTDETPPEANSPRPGDSILDAIARRSGRSPKVSLHDVGTSGEGVILDPKAH